MRYCRILAEVMRRKKKKNELCTRETGVDALDALHEKINFTFNELEKWTKSMIKKCPTKGISNEW